jgi:hypothetical protein
MKIRITPFSPIIKISEDVRCKDGECTHCGNCKRHVEDKKGVFGLRSLKPNWMTKDTKCFSFIEDEDSCTDL